MDEMTQSIKSTTREIIFKFRQLMNTYKAEQMQELVDSLKNESYPQTAQEIETWEKCLNEIQVVFFDKRKIFFGKANFQKKLLANAISQLKLK